MTSSLDKIEKILLFEEEPSISKTDMEKAGVFTLTSDQMLKMFGGLED